MSRCPVLAAILAWSIVVFKYDGRSRPVYTVRRWWA